MSTEKDPLGILVAEEPKATSDPLGILGGSEKKNSTISQSPGTSSKESELESTSPTEYKYSWSDTAPVKTVSLAPAPSYLVTATTPEKKSKVQVVNEHTSTVALSNPELYSKKENRDQYINSLGIEESEKKQVLADFDKYAASAQGLKDEIENIKKDPANPEPKLKVVDHFISLNRPEEARKMADNLIASNPDYSPAYFYKAKTYADVGDFEPAIGALTEGIKNNPGDAALYNNRAVVKNQAGDTQGAVQDLDAGITMTNNPHVLQNLWTEKAVIFNKLMQDKTKPEKWMEIINNENKPHLDEVSKDFFNEKYVEAFNEANKYASMNKEVAKTELSAEQEGLTAPTLPGELFVPGKLGEAKSENLMEKPIDERVKQFQDKQKVDTQAELTNKILNPDKPYANYILEYFKEGGESIFGGVEKVAEAEKIFGKGMIQVAIGNPEGLKTQTKAVLKAASGAMQSIFGVLMNFTPEGVAINLGTKGVDSIVGEDVSKFLFAPVTSIYEYEVEKTAKQYGVSKEALEKEMGGETIRDITSILDPIPLMLLGAAKAKGVKGIDGLEKKIENKEPLTPQDGAAYINAVVEVSKDKKVLQEIGDKAGVKLKSEDALAKISKLTIEEPPVAGQKPQELIATTEITPEEIPSEVIPPIEKTPTPKEELTGASVAVAPFYDATVTSVEHANEIRKSPAYKVYIEKFHHIAKQLGIKILNIEDNIGSWKKNQEVSNVIHLDVKSLDEAEKFAALAGVHGPEVQHSTIASQYVKKGDVNHNAEEHIFIVDNPEMARKALDDAGLDFTLDDKNGRISIIEQIKDNNSIELANKFAIFESKLKEYGGHIKDTTTRSLDSRYIDSGRREEIFQQIQEGRQPGGEDLYNYVAEGQKKNKQFIRERKLDSVRDKFNKLRDREKAGEILSDADLEKLNKYKEKLTPSIKQAVISAQDAYKEAKKEIDTTAQEVVGDKGFVSPVGLKKPERATEKILSWYEGKPNKLGDGARTNIVVYDIKDAPAIIDALKKKYEGGILRSPEGEKTALGFNKNLLEVRSSNGRIVEFQVITPKDLIAKEGVEKFPQEQQQFAKEQLAEVSKEAGQNIPGGVGHWLYEINRDLSVPKELRDEASEVSKTYYQAFADPKAFKESGKDINTLLGDFEKKIESADKSKWDVDHSKGIPKTITLEKPSAEMVKEKAEQAKAKLSQIKDVAQRVEEARAKAAQALEDIAKSIGGIKEISGEQKPELLKAITDLASALAEELGIRGEELWNKIKEKIDAKWHSFLEENKDEILFMKEEKPKTAEEIKARIQELKPQNKPLKQMIIDFAKDNKVTQLATSIVKAFHPFWDIESRKAAITIRKRSGEMKHALSQIAEASKGLRDMFAKRSWDDNVAFILGIENPVKYGMPEGKLRQVAESYKKRLDDVFKQISTIKDLPYIEDYFPHFWKDPAKAKTFFGELHKKRPMEGGKSFLKQRFHEDILSGLEAGLELISDNPEEIVRLAEINAWKFKMAHNIFEDFKEQGLMKFARNKGDAPEGWQLVNDPIFKRKSFLPKDAEKDFATMIDTGGGYYMPADAARVVDNYLSRGLSGKPLYDIMRDFNNTLNQFQLGLSFFHGSTTTLEAAFTSQAIGLNEILRGNMVKGFKDLAGGLISPLTTPFGLSDVARIGKKTSKDYLSGVTNDRVAMLIKANANVGLDKFYRTDAYNNFVNSLAKGSWKAIPQLPFAILDLVAKPIFEHYVPRLKVGSFIKLAESELAKLDNPTEQQIDHTIQKAWDSTDNRLGQMVYDNIFWDKMTKDLGFLTVRSLGWTGGSIREIGGAIGDIPKSVRDVAKGKGVSPRTAWLMTVIGGTAMYGGMTNYLLTGEAPQEPEDYFHPRTGGTNKDGSPARLNLPTYLKDVISYGKDPIRTLSNKMSPLISDIINIYKNEDFYRRNIRNPEDPAYEQGLDILKYELGQAVPFSYRNKKGEEKTILETIKSKFTTKEGLLQQFGLMPAPPESAEKKARYYQLLELLKKYRKEKNRVEEIKVKKIIDELNYRPY